MQPRHIPEEPHNRSLVHVHVCVYRYMCYSILILSHLITFMYWQTVLPYNYGVWHVCHCHTPRLQGQYMVSVLQTIEGVASWVGSVSTGMG